MQAKRFIELLKSQQLLSPEIVDELLRQVAESKTKLTPELLAKLLVDNGHLTKFQATKLIAEIRDASQADQQGEEDELGLAPSGELDSAEAGQQAALDDSNLAAVFIDDDEVAEVEVVEVADDVVEVVDVEPVEVVEAIAEPAAEDDFGSSAPRPTTAKVARAAKPKSNPWDSFRILGVGIILALVIIVGYFLINHFWRGNAEERLAQADSAYEQRSYETAAGMYTEFTANFPTDPQASYATVRSALATLRDDSEGAPDPKIGLRTALEVLPGIVDEPGLADQQSDLAGALIALAGKFNERADKAPTTAERKELMGDMERLLDLINNPQFVGATQRNQQAPTLLRIQEDRQRILREINRDEELATALSEIDQKLEAKDTLGAYAIRRELINRYPLLEADSSLTDRVTQATVLQQSLVTLGTVNAKLNSQAPASVVGRRFALANRTGDGAPDLAGQTLFFKVKGSVYGIDGASGNVLWRNYVGREFRSDPIRLGETSSSDALICQPEKGRISRVDGRTGETRWHWDLSAPVHMPVAESEDLFVASFDGMVASLDNVSGQTKWATQLPQPVQVPLGAALGKPNLYLPAEHSNLYVISRKDGSCREVHYLGHRSGSIAVPPILLLGQLFVFENRNSETASIRILQTSDDGLNLTNAQTPIPIGGNIVVPPQIDGRRLIVQSDLGQILVLDIEPTAESQKVSVIASVPKTLHQPRVSWMVAERNKIWVADNRFTRFDLQVSLQKLSRAWIRNDGDQFAAPPQKFGDVVVHARTLSGNRGVRVAAVDADSGDAFWETDLGVPVTLVTSSGQGKYDAVNTGGMLFELSESPLTNQADANPGQGRPAMTFTNPVFMGQQSAALFNQSRSNQLAFYSAAGTKLTILSANFGGAAPSCEAVAVGEVLGVGLDNGQFVTIDPTNGSLTTTPYLPPMGPGKKVQWNTPVYLPDSQTLIVASDLQKLVRLGVGDALRSLTEVDLEAPLTGPLVSLGSQVAAVQSTSAGDSLVFFDATSLTKGESLPLQGRVIAGPYPSEIGCVVQTDARLVAISPESKQLWSIEFASSRLVAAPTQLGSNLVLATRSGEVWLVSSDSGEVVASVDAGQSFSSAPLVLPMALLLGTDEGDVLALPIPTSRAEGL